MVAIKEMAKDKKSSGKGPGRPPSEKTTTSIRVSSDLSEMLTEIAKYRGVSVPQLLEELLQAKVREEVIEITKLKLEKWGQK